ncbi:MAG TPA: DUF1329 domain-containing protein [Candidatus Binataceae bacterium]|nr:DUF1329 domain-containing protein [Candidatus Binataceae bacterium]
MGLHKGLMIGLLGLCLIAPSARAADDTIPVGTKITLQNWQKYKDYMPQGLQTVLAGTTVWKVPADAVMEVGPPVDYPLPKSWYDASEKYKNQTKLVKLDTGGYTLQGYQAGIPFTDYSGPDAAYKILYDLYYHYGGVIAHYESTSYEIDRYLNTANNLSFQVFLQFTHISDPGFPGYAREMPGYFSSYYNELEEPEQSKYTTPLELIFDDPQKLPEFYVFLPSLRRALRLSSSARCAPYAGGDYVGDDIYAGVPLPVGWFQAKYLGKKKMLMFRPNPSNTEQFDIKNYYYPPLLFPKPTIGKWQVFDAVMIDISRVPGESAGYCYANRRVYADPRTWNIMWIDLFDQQNKFWKVMGWLESPEPVPEGGYVPNIRGVNWMVDFQNSHASFALVGKDTFQVNQQVPKQFYDVTRYGSPAGLQKIMK